MTEISEDLYWTRVRKDARSLAKAAEDAAADGEFSDVERAVYELARGVLATHGWFDGEAEGNAAMYGEIVDHSEVNPSEYMDMDTFIVGEDDAPEIFRSLAYLSYESDVMERAAELATPQR